MKRLFFWMVIAVVMSFASCQPEPVKVSIVATSDLETALFSYDYKNSFNSRGGATVIASYLKEIKSQYGEENVVYVDNGDILSGWPLNYYMKNVEKGDTTIAAFAMNHLGCEVYGIGDGDLAQGKDLLARHVGSINAMPVCANLLDAKSGKPMYKPYAIVERNGMKIAFLGLITESANKYMNDSFMDGLTIENAEMCAKKWIAEIKKNEHPDVVIGLFHMGASSLSKRTKSRENMALTIARNVAGFDAIVCGHDGLRRSRTVENVDGKKVVLASPGRRGMYAINIAVTAERTKSGFENKTIDVSIKSMLAGDYDKEYVAYMRPRVSELRKNIITKVATVEDGMKAIDALFGSSAYVDLLHRVQLKYSDADFSFAHPFVIGEVCSAGNISISDIYRFYPVRGKLYTIKIKGSEIRDMLLYSVSKFYKTLKDENSLLLKYDTDKGRLSENCRNLESVAGLRYNVHLNKKKDEGRLQILGMTSGKSFDLNKEYTVAVGEDYVMNANLALNLGAKIKSNEISGRVIAVSEKDVTELVLDYLKENNSINMKPLGNWTLHPIAWMGAIKQNETTKLYEMYFPINNVAVTEPLVKEDMLLLD